MTQYNSLNVKRSNSQLNKLKSAIKNESDVVLRISSSMVGNSNDNINFPHKLWLIDRQVANICKAFSNNLSMPLAKNVLAPLGLTAAMSAIDESIKKKMLGSGTTTLIISNDEMNDIIKIIKALENSGVLLKGVNKTIENATKEQRGGFLPMLLGTLGASLLGNLLTGGKGVIRAGEGTKKN